MTDTDTTLADLEALVDARLAALGVVPMAEPRAAVDPNGTPGLVVSGELIESAWGNAVTNNVDGLVRFMGQTTAPYVGGWAPAWPVGGATLRAGHGAFSTSAFGDARVNFTTPFPTGVISVVITSNEISKGIFWWPQISATDLAGFNFFAVAVNGHPYATGHPPSQPNVYTMGSGTVTLDYMAFGV